MTRRDVTRLIPALETSDGAGVKLRRSLGQRQGIRLDPFLMLDEFYSDNPDDYIAGFPPHPHRGFETVTYMLAGHMLHEDHLGNRGHLKDGAVQWMTAGRGVIHSEMPQQNAGMLRGFQLWINLPAAEKMRDADYSDVPGNLIPRRTLRQGGVAVLIAGQAILDGERVSGYFNGLNGRKITTDPIYIDLQLAPGGNTELQIPPQHNVFVYSYEGSATVGDTVVPPATAAICGAGTRLEVTASNGPASLLVLAARPIGEAVAQYGPFVMNSQEEIEQALRDYRNNTLTD